MGRVLGSRVRPCDSQPARLCRVVLECHDSGTGLARASATWGRPWNAVDTGPRRDLLGDLSSAVRRKGLRQIRPACTGSVATAWVGAHGRLCSSGRMMSATLPLLPDRFQLAIAFCVDLLLPARQHILLRDVAGGAALPLPPTSQTPHPTPRQAAASMPANNTLRGPAPTDRTRSPRCPTPTSIPAPREAARA